MTDTPDKALYAKCPDCGFIWVAAWYPVMVSEFAETMKRNSVCDRCGGQAVLAKQKDGVLEESPNARGLPV